MLRVLFCIGCCGTPKDSRPVRGKNSVVQKNEKLVEQATFKSLINFGESEKNKLLTDESKSNIESYGAKNDDSQGMNSSPVNNVTKQNKLDQMMLKEDTITAPTPSPSQQQAKAPKQTDAKSFADYSATELNFDYDDRSGSSTSSIDIEAFSENPSKDQKPAILAGSESNGSQQDEREDESNKVESSEVETQISPSHNIPSTTKIGDYARIEYSPVEDLESLTTVSQSRYGSEKGTGQLSVAESSVDKQDSLADKNVGENRSRRSSQGIESSSISIASQLSNEQLQQNLTNMLESANSPIAMFGTIGLPLGPPLDNMMTETAKTSPETTGAALTSGSQDSLSDNSVASDQASRLMTVQSRSSGAALVNDSMERSYLEDSVELNSIRKSPSFLDDRKSTVTKINDNVVTERVESSMSMNTTTSGGLTNPTPTPSEMSSNSSKKKRKLRAKSLLKKLRPGSKKKTKDQSEN